MLRRPWSTKHKYMGSACQSELVHRLADNYGLMYSPVKRLIDSFLDSIVDELSQGHFLRAYRSYVEQTPSPPREGGLHRPWLPSWSG